MVSGEQGRGPGVGKAPSQRCMSDLVGQGRVPIAQLGVRQGPQKREIGEEVVGSKRNNSQGGSLE